MVWYVPGLASKTLIKAPRAVLLTVAPSVVGAAPAGLSSLVTANSRRRRTAPRQTERLHRDLNPTWENTSTVFTRVQVTNTRRTPTFALIFEYQGVFSRE